MDTIDELIKQTLEHQADQVRDAPIARNVTHRIRSQNRLRVAGSATVVTLIATAGIWGTGQLMNSDVTATPASTTLLDSGTCAGLSVIVGGPNDGPVDSPSPREPLDAQSLEPGLNTISMDRKDHLWFQATGPCRDRIALVPQGPALQGLASGSRDAVPFSPSPNGDEPVSSVRESSQVAVATVHANTDQAVTEDLALILLLDCDFSTCEPIATLRVNVTDDATDNGSKPGTQETAPPGP